MSNINSYLASLESFAGTMPNAKIDADKQPLNDADFNLLAGKVDRAVCNFLKLNTLVSGAVKADEAVMANESFDLPTMEQTVPFDTLYTFVTVDCGVPTCYAKQAMEQLGIIMHRHIGAGRRATNAWNAQNMPASQMDNHKGEAALLTSIFPQSIAQEMLGHGVPSEESFGANIDSVIPDLKLAISTAILKFHSGITHRILPNRPTAVPNVQYIKTTLEVYDLSSPDSPLTPILDLYDDPSTVKNDLQVIVPLTANDSQTAPVLVANGVIKFGPEANLQALSIDATKPGFVHYNRTDLVADAAKIKSVQISLALAGTPNVVETFEINVNNTKSRMVRMADSDSSADRIANIEYVGFINKDTKRTNGAASVILSTVTEAAEGLRVLIVVNAKLNLMTGVVRALGNVEISAVNSLSATAVLSSDVTDLVTAIKATAGATYTTGAFLVGYTLEAKFSEENMRKTNIAVRSRRSPYSYDIPTGRNYVLDYALGQQNAEDNAASLTKIIRIGQDEKVLRMIIETLDYVYNQVQMYEGNPMDKKTDPGTAYVAGSRVRPYVYTGTMALEGLLAIKTADRSGDIKQYALTFLNAVIEKVMIKSKFRQQLPGDTTPTLKLITSGLILGNVLGIPHIHNHLSNQDKRGNSDGVEYRLVLPSGVVLEVVTTTFEYMRSKIIMIPTIPDSPESELNLGHNWDYGTMVGHYTPANENAHHRLYANAREMPIITCPIGAQIDVTGIDEVTFITAPTAP